MPLLLPERLHPRDLANFRSEALSCVASGESLAIDAGQSPQLPLAWIQLLVSAVREAASRGLTVTILNPTFAFLFSFEALGLQPETDLFKLEYAQ